MNFKTNVEFRKRKSYIKPELTDRYSKYVKTIANRIVEVEFSWFQVNPRQSYRLRIDEKQFTEAQKHIHSKKLLNMKFDQFTHLITPIFAHETTTVSDFVLRSTFDNLFDQNSNGKIEQEEFETLFILLQGFDTDKHNLLQENLRKILDQNTKYITYKEFYDFVKCGYLRHVFMSITALILSDFNGYCLNIVRKFAQQGYNIALNGSQFDKNIIRNIQNDYRQCQFMHVSNHIRNEIDIHELVEQVLKQFKKIDIVIINNDCKRHYRAAIDEFPTEKWREIIDHNVILTFALVKTLWPYMKRQYFGRIINIANEHSVIDGEYKSACITSYHALYGLNKAISIEGASFGITSNIIYPGGIKTNLFEHYDDMKTFSDLILFLCSDQARSITGQSIPWLLT